MMVALANCSEFQGSRSQAGSAAGTSSDRDFPEVELLEVGTPDSNCGGLGEHHHLLRLAAVQGHAVRVDGDRIGAGHDFLRLQQIARACGAIGSKDDSGVNDAQVLPAQRIQVGDAL